MVFKTASGMDFGPVPINTGDGTTELYRKVGESVVGKALENLVQNSGPAAGGPVSTQLKELAETVKSLSGVYREQEEGVIARLKEERQARENAERALLDMRAAGAKENLEFFKIIIEMLDKSEQRFQALLERLEEKKTRGGDDDFFKTLAMQYLQTLQRAASSDPDAEIERRLEQVKKLGDLLAPRMSIEDQIKWFTVTQEMALKKEQAQSEEQRAKEHAAILQQAINSLAQWFSTRQPPAAAAPAAGVEASLQRFVCQDCGEQVVLRAGVRPRACPACGRPVEQATEGGA